MTNKILAPLCLLLVSAGGCATTARYVTAEHWHDDNTFFIGYTEYEETNYIVTTSGSSTAHITMCRAQADNKAVCRPQVAVDRLLNPDEKFADPAPAEAAPAAAPEAPAEAAPAAAPADPAAPQS